MIEVRNNTKLVALTLSNSCFQFGLDLKFSDFVIKDPNRTYARKKDKRTGHDT